MRRKGYKGRCEKRMLSKCKEVCRAYDAIQSAYADLLESNEDILEFRCNVPLDGVKGLLGSSWSDRLGVGDRCRKMNCLSMTE